MVSSTLTPIQVRVLELLAGSDPPWTLTGGGALAGFHLGHRTTRDLDLFLHGRRTLGDSVARAMDKLRAAGFDVVSKQAGDALHRLVVSRSGDSVVLDLVAEPVATVEPPMSVKLGSVRIQIDTKHEILVNKLCTLIERSEIRDLIDVKALLDAGGDLERGLAEAPRKDGGFSSLILAWQLNGLALATMAEAAGLEGERVVELDTFRRELSARLTSGGPPGA